MTMTLTKYITLQLTETCTVWSIFVLGRTWRVAYLGERALRGASAVGIRDIFKGGEGLLCEQCEILLVGFQ